MSDTNKNVNQDQNQSNNADKPLVIKPDHERSGPLSESEKAHNWVTITDTHIGSIISKGNDSNSLSKGDINQDD